MTQHDFSAVYDEHVWQVYGFFAYGLSNRSDAEDLTQLTFERALRSWGRYDASRGSEATWLMAIARNLLVDHFRRDRTGRHVSLDEPDTEVDRLAATSDRPDLGIDPGLERALAGLTERERELIGLRFGADLTGPEIAELTGLSLANVQQILSRSLRRLRAEIGNMQGVGEPAEPNPERRCDRDGKRLDDSPDLH